MASTNVKLAGASECLVGCTLLGLDPFDGDLLVEWDDRSTCDDSAGCEVNTGDTLTYWLGCGAADASRCLWASSSGEDGSSDCTCSVCGTANSFASSYMSDDPTWTRIACYIADMEWVGYSASECVAAVVDGGAMACVDEAYEVPTVSQFSCPSTGISLNTGTECVFDGPLRKAEEMFEIIGKAETPAPTPSSVIPETPAPSSAFSTADITTVDTPAPLVAEETTDYFDGKHSCSIEGGSTQVARGISQSQERCNHHVITAFSSYFRLCAQYRGSLYRSNKTGLLLEWIFGYSSRT